MGMEDTTIAVSVRVSIRTLVELGGWLQESGHYRAAKPSGALAYALRMLVMVLEGTEQVRPCTDFNEAMVRLGMLRYPTDQIEKALQTQQVREERASQQAETMEVLGAPLRALSQLREKTRGMSPADLQELERRMSGSVPTEFDAAAFQKTEEEKLAEEKENMRRVLAQARGAGMVVASEEATEK